MKKLALFFTLILFLFPVAAQQYKIEDINYSIQGCGHPIFGITQEYALAQQVPIDNKKVFQNTEEL